MSGQGLEGPLHGAAWGSAGTVTARSPGDGPRGRCLQGWARDDQDSSVASRPPPGLCSTPAPCESYSALSKWAGPGPHEQGSGQNGPQRALLPPARLLLMHASRDASGGAGCCSDTDGDPAGPEGQRGGRYAALQGFTGVRPRSRPSYLTSLSRFLLGEGWTQQSARLKGCCGDGEARCGLGAERAPSALLSAASLAAPCSGGGSRKLPTGKREGNATNSALAISEGGKTDTRPGRDLGCC